MSSLTRHRRLGMPGALTPIRWCLRGGCAAIVSAVVSFAPATSSVAQSVADPGDGPRALAVQYADGRTTYRVLRPSGGASWTPAFPRVPHVETSKNGLPLTALEVAHAVKGPDVIVTVSLLYGSPHQNRVRVATVGVTPENPVRVDQLTSYGVEPISLFIATVSPTLLHSPSVITPSAQLDVVVEAVPGEVPAYRMVIVNRSPQALIGFQFEGHRGDRRVFSGRRKAVRHVPLVQPGAEYVFEMPATMSNGMETAEAWLPLDRVAITSVMWIDGIVEGDAEPAASERALAAGSAQQIVRVLALLREAGQAMRPQSPAGLRSSIAALSIIVSRAEAVEVHASLPDPQVLAVERVHSSMQMGMQQVKEAALADLDVIARAEPSGDAKGYELWLAKSAVDYEGWLARIGNAVR
jgi:hypothetical protein